MGGLCEEGVARGGSRWLGWLGVDGQRAKAEKESIAEASRVFWKENGLQKIFP